MLNPHDRLFDAVRKKNAIDRLESMRLWQVRDGHLVVRPGVERFEQLFEVLQELAGGAFDVGDVEEVWSGRGLFRWRRQLQRVSFEANGAVVVFTPELVEGVLPLDTLLGAANAAVTGGGFADAGALVGGDPAPGLSNVGWFDDDTRAVLAQLGHEPDAPPSFPVEIVTPPNPG